MKKRILALLLSVVITFSLVMPALTAQAASGISVYHNGEAVTAVSFPENVGTTVSAPSVEGCSAYQWQILIPGTNTWVNIYQENEKSLELSLAMIANMVNNKDAARIRCCLTVSGEKIYSEPVSVTTSEAVYPKAEPFVYVPAEAPVNKAKNEAPAPAKEAPAQVNVEENAEVDVEGVDGEELVVAAFAEEEASIKATATLNSYTIQIKYVFADGSLAAQSWEGTFTEGSSYTLDVTSPKVNGYVADKAKIEKTYTSITADETFTVTYTPTQVKYTVKHFQQNVSGEDYTEVTADRVEHNDKYANDQVGAGHANTYTGFKTLDYDTTTAIAADGSTELEIYYDRLYYLMSFDLEGGYGVEPIYARYGTPISVGTPSKAGYTFNGWNKTIPSTMPAENTKFTASWVAGNTVNVNVVFWYENANDDNYTFVGSAKTAVAYNEGKKVKADDFDDLSFTNRDDLHFKFNASNSLNTPEVTLKADGSTIVNVYFTRNRYLMIFYNCMKSGHTTDTIDCYPRDYKNAHDWAINTLNDLGVDYTNNDVVGKEVASGNRPWQLSVYTRKWQQNVRPDWAAGIANREATRRWMPYAVNGADGKQIYNGELNVSTMNVMPDADIVFWFKSKGEEKCTMNYWVTPAPGESLEGKTTKEDNGITYILKDQVVTMMGGITEKEEYVDIEGFTKVYTWSQLDTMGYRTSGSGWNKAEMFYSRNSYKLAYINDGETVKTVDVPFEALIKGANNNTFVPAYPSDWEPGAYEFAGWYLDENCTVAVDWNTQKMPVGGFSVYAKWAPVIHTVNLKDYANGGVIQSYKVAHGDTLTDPPANPTKDGYEFIAWFYVDENGVEKPFTFEMPIKNDIDLYPKWKEVAIVKGTISYELEDGTKIADDSAIEALVGDTKTYDAKANEQLYADYQEHYFPKEVSHSITFKMDQTENVYTFVYVYKDSVPYTVKYLEEGTEKVLAEEKHVDSTKAAVTENFKPIAGYLPDLYKKTLLLDADDENVLIFWYHKDAESAPILRGHYLENAEDDEYTTYQELVDGYGKIGQSYSEDPLTSFVGVDYNGFTLNESKSTMSGVLTADGLELKLYYDRNLYPYEFRFVDTNGKVLKTSVTGTAKFEATVSYEAPVIPGYELIMDDEMISGTPKKEIDIAIEDDVNTAVKNVKTFVYKAALADLKITKSGANTTLDPNQTFMFHITGTPADPNLPAVDMMVTISGNGDVDILDLPVGNYTVTEIEDWSWRYETENSFQITLNDPENTTEVEFVNERKNSSWLSGDSWCKNIWGTTSFVAHKTN